MKLAFIYLGITKCGFNCFGQIGNKEANFMNHGIGSLSSYLKNEGHQISLFDLRRLKDWHDFERKIKLYKGGIFAISTTSESYHVAEECAQRIKRARPDSIIFIGGVHPTVATQDVAKNTNYDYLILGEGEITLALSLKKLQNNEKLERIQTGIIPDINRLPFVDRNIFHYDRGELNNPWLDCLSKPFVSIITSRGCMFNCSFCQPAERKIFGNKVRKRSVDNVMKELKLLRKKYSFKSFFVHDDNFLTDADYLKDFLKKYKKERFKAKFVCQARADFICKNEDLLAELAKIGLTSVMIGFESGSQKILNFIRKGTTVEQNLKAAKICKKNNIKIFANYMFGLPTETLFDSLKTLIMIRKINPEYPSPSFFTPYPSSDLYDYCKKNHLIKMKFNDYEGYRRSPSFTGKIKGVNYPLLQILVLMSYGFKNIFSALFTVLKERLKYF